jgi:hypothetical protein
MQAQPSYPGTRDASSQELIWTSGSTGYDFNDSTTLDSHRTTIYNTGVSHISVWYVGSGVWF